MLSPPVSQRVCDHRIRHLVRETGAPHRFPELHTRRSTIAGWLKEPPPDMVTADCMSTIDLALDLLGKNSSTE